MPILEINQEKTSISIEQKDKLIRLLKEANNGKMVSLKESYDNQLVHIVVDGIVFELIKKTYENYVEMIKEILKDK